MTSIQSQRENVDSLRAALLELLDGMNYCLDWKPDDSQWSAREIVYHLLDTPPGGMASVVGGIVSGDISEYEIWSDRTNVTEARATLDMDEIQGDIAAFFDTFNDRAGRGHRRRPARPPRPDAPAHPGRGHGAHAGGGSGRLRPPLARPLGAAGGATVGAGVLG